MRTLIAALLIATPLTAATPSRLRSDVDISKAAVFVAVTPCRLADTRNATGPYGGPAFTAAQTRTFSVPSGPCSGIPIAAAYSMNFTITNYTAAAGSFIVAFPAGTTRPGVSTLNWGPGGPIANAAVVPASSNGSIDVYAGAATDVIIDLNGYYLDADAPLNSGNSLALNGSVANSGVIYALNTTTTSGTYTTGVLGEIETTNLTDGAGVTGLTHGGPTWGVKGIDTAYGTNSGGVLGVSGGTRVGAGLSFNAAGVRGESVNGFGVLGNTQNAAGVGGCYLDSGGNITMSGYLANGTYAVYAAGNFAATGTKSFVDPHPTDPSKVIRFVALEGPEAGTYFRGRGRIQRGRAVIEVPDAFRMTSEEDGMTVHLTTIGGLALIGVARQSLDRIEVEASKDVEFSYIVYGVRRGYRDFEPIADGTEFAPTDTNARLPLYLNEEQKRRLIENGTYNEDGSVNMNTAARLGWTLRSTLSAAEGSVDPPR
ncbi:MAG TPA: hypothetical protein VF787_27120 [Thermoanaerobaculia bacterium]